MNIYNIEPFEVPLDIKAHGLAKKFSDEQSTSQKGQLVYFNTLAVYAVNTYLKWIGIETDLRQSESWNPFIRYQGNVADLVIPGIGILECRPFILGESVIHLPPEATEDREDRIGFVAVQFYECLDQAIILGFVKAVESEFFHLDHLKPMEELIEEILSVVCLNEQKWPEGWEVIDGRNRDSANVPIKAASDIQNQKAWRKVLIVGGDNKKLELIIKFKQDNDRFNVLVTLKPGEESNYLPLGLEFYLISHNGELLNWKRVEESEIFIKKRLFLKHGFMLKVSLDKITTIERFRV
ncbi:MAG: DUF1822 family protein [Moorea sp. SIO2I5]|nr:DUF1822 family protein [Moorena sp. SIO2I5]